MSKDIEKEGKQVPPVSESEENTPVQEVSRTNTGVKIDNPAEMEEAGEER